MVRSRAKPLFGCGLSVHAVVCDECGDYLLGAARKIRRIRVHGSDLRVHGLCRPVDMTVDHRRVVTFSFLIHTASGDMLAVLGNKGVYLVVFSSFEGRSASPEVKKYSWVSPKDIESEYHMLTGLGVEHPSPGGRPRDRDRATLRSIEILVKDFETFKTRLVEQLNIFNRSHSAVRALAGDSGIEAGSGENSVVLYVPTEAAASPVQKRETRDADDLRRSIEETLVIQARRDDVETVEILRSKIEAMLVHQGRQDDADDRDNEVLREEIRAQRKRRDRAKNARHVQATNAVRVSGKGKGRHSYKDGTHADVAMDAHESAKESSRKETSIETVRMNKVLTREKKKQYLAEMEKMEHHQATGLLIGGH